MSVMVPLRNAFRSERGNQFLESRGHQRDSKLIKLGAQTRSTSAYRQLPWFGVIFPCTIPGIGTVDGDEYTAGTANYAVQAIRRFRTRTMAESFDSLSNTRTDSHTANTLVPGYTNANVYNGSSWVTEDYPFFGDVTFYPDTSSNFGRSVAPASSGTKSTLDTASGSLANYIPSIVYWYWFLDTWYNAADTTQESMLAEGSTATAYSETASDLVETRGNETDYSDEMGAMKTALAEFDMDESGASSAILWKRWPLIAYSGSWDGTQDTITDSGTWSTVSTSMIKEETKLNTADNYIEMPRFQVRPRSFRQPYWVFEFPTPQAGFSSNVPVTIRETGTTSLNVPIEGVTPNLVLGSVVSGYPVISIQVAVSLGVPPAIQLARTYPGYTFSIS